MIHQRPWGAAATHDGQAWSWLRLLVLVLLLGGCATYQPMPLTPQAVDRALAPPEMATLAATVTTLHHPLLHPVPVDLARGLTPDAAAILAVVGNPVLRGERDRRALASAQLLQAGVLPNPVLTVGSDIVTGGHAAGTFPGYSGGLSWDVTALLTQSTHTAAARAASEAVQLDVAWKEWQFAQAAQKAVYDLVALRAQRREAEAVDRRLADNVALLREAVTAFQRTLLDLAAAEAASQQAHADVLAASRDLQHQQLVLNAALGLPSDTVVPVADDIVLPSRLALPPQEALLTGLEDRRLDLLALRRGYESQEQTLHAAVLAQFPKIALGFHQASDTSNVHTTGFGVSIDLPIFDRNQGHIAMATATRQQLFDEYVSRVFEARAAVAQSVADIQALTAQIAAAEAAIPALEQVVRTYGVALEQHNADVLSSYRAQNDLAQKRIAVLKLKQQLMENMSALEIAAGVYLPLETRGPAHTAHLPTMEGQP
jgi:outer membrane protein, heavy metal efflux system